MSASMRFGFVLAATFSVFGCAQKCESENGCYVEFVVDSTDLVASDSLEAIALVTSVGGENYVMVGGCAYGNLPGTLVKIKYFSEVPYEVEFEVHSVGGDGLISAEVVSKKLRVMASGDFKQYSDSVVCY